MPNVVNVHVVLIGRGAQTLGNIVKFLSTVSQFYVFHWPVTDTVKSGPGVENQMLRDVFFS